jgi:predicted AAA+ superfamily ATPase
MIHVVRFIIENTFSLAGERITFEGFANSNFRSREMGEAFRLLEKTMLLQMVYPVVNTGLPLNIKNRSPKLQMLDTGLVNYKAGIQGELLGSTNIEDAYRGKIAEHVTGQELLSSENSVLARLNYWSRDTKNAQAEVDFVISFNGLLVPIEVKSGASGKLRSLHRFMDEAPHTWAVRVYSGKLIVETVNTLAGKAYTLINIPFYLTGRLEKVLAQIIK